MSAVSKVLTQTIPARIRRDSRWARLTSRVQSPPPARTANRWRWRSPRPRRRTRSRSGPARRSPRGRPASCSRRRRGWSARRSSRRLSSRTRSPPATTRAPSCAPELDVAEHLGQLAVVDDRAEPGPRVERLAGRQLPPEGRDPLDQLLADGAVDDEPRAGVAGLAAVVEDPPADRRGGRLEVADVGSTTCGLLPPSSSEIALTSDSPTARSSDLPTSVEPVKAILSTPGWRASASPMTAPGPVTTLRTPSGSPASAASSARRSAVSGDWLAGLSTTELPVASAAPSFQARDDQRVVPRHDRGDDADRLAGDQRQRVGAGRADLAVGLVDRLGVPLEGRRRARDVDR